MNRELRRHLKFSNTEIGSMTVGPEWGIKIHLQCYLDLARLMEVTQSRSHLSSTRPRSSRLEVSVALVLVEPPWLGTEAQAAWEHFDF